MAFRRIALITLLSVFATSIFAQTSPTAAPATSIIRIDPRFDELVPKDTELELVAEDIIWAEGPVWDKQGGFLLFSDAPRNSAYKWSTKEAPASSLLPASIA
jgi:gluconolactonase